MYSPGIGYLIIALLGSVTLFSAGAADGRNFWSFFFFECGACHHQAPKLGLNGMRIDGYVALLTSDQTIDRPSKEPSLGLDSFTFLGSRMVSFRTDVFVIFMVLSKNNAIKLNMRINVKTRIEVR